MTMPDYILEMNEDQREEILKALNERHARLKNELDWCSKVAAVVFTCKEKQERENGDNPTRG